LELCLKTVLHIIDTTGPGGAEQVFLQLAQGLNDAEYRSIALIRGDGWLQANLTKNNVRFHVRECKGSFNVRFLYDMIALVKREKVDLIQSHLLGSNVYAAVVGRLCQVPVVATFHGKVDIRSNERWLKAKLALVAALCSRIICVSESLQDYLLLQIPQASKKVVVINNGISSPAIRSPNISAQSLIEGGSRGAVLGALGNIRAPKAYPVFVEAVAILRERGESVSAQVAGQGSGALMERLLGDVEKYDLHGTFEFIGFTDEPYVFLAGLDYYVLSSSSEGHPLALAQAMMLGLPVIATRCGVEDLMEHGVDCWIVEKDNPQALADGISAVLSREDRGAALGLAAKEKAHKMFSLATMLDAYQLEYQALLSPKQRNGYNRARASNTARSASNNSPEQL
jgi:glycosyltransferase involved in cell wall biosynthesis